MEIISTLCFSIKSLIIFLLPSISGFGGTGKITPVSSTLPVSSTTATLQPVRYPGSSPSVTFPLTGGCNNSGRRFTSNIFIACSLALSVRIALTSLSILGSISLSYPSSAASSISFAHWVSFLFFINFATHTRFAIEGSKNILTFKHSSFSPLFIASMR